jgi:DNA-binding CsgD family transcriptional regulator
MKTRGRPPHPDILTPRQFEVLELLREGLSNPQIAQRLGISLDTVKDHVSEILGKLGMASREEAALWRRETHRPWWTAAFAPMAWLWRKAGAVAQSPGALAAGAAGVAFGATVAGLAFVGFLLATGGDGSESEPASLIAPTPTVQPSATGPVEVTMNEVGGSGANGTATLTERETDFPPTELLADALVEIASLRADIVPPITGTPLGPHGWKILPGSCATQPLEVPPSLELPLQPLDTVTDGFHYIVVYDLVADGGAMVSCGDIPAVSPIDGTAHTERVDSVQLTMREQDASGVAGDVILWTQKDGVGVGATTNAAPGWHASHIHSGACAAPGPAERFLGGFYGQPGTGAGMLSQAVGTELATLQDGNHYVDVHEEATGGAIVNCVDIPAAAPAAGATPTHRTDLIELSMHERHGSGVMGDVVLWERGNGVGIAADILAGPDSISIRSRPGGRPYPLLLHIHEGGSCATSEVYPTGRYQWDWVFNGAWEPRTWFGGESAVVGAGNLSYQGSSATDLDLASLRDGSHYIDLHVGTGASGGIEYATGGPLACADIPQEPS